MSLFNKSNLPPCQLQVWIANKLFLGQPLYNLPVALTVFGDIDPIHFRRAFQSLVNSSDALRMVFEEIHGVPIRRVISNLDYDLPFLDFSITPEPDAAVKTWIRERAAGTLDLKERSFDAALLKVSANEIVWYLNVHHLVCDAWSVQLIYQYLAQLYAAAMDGNLAKNIALNSFEAVLAAKEQGENSRRTSKAQAYWKQKLSDESKRMRFYGMLANKTSTHVTRKTVDLGPERIEKLKRVVCKIDQRDTCDDTSIQNTFYAVLCAYLARFHDRWDCFVGMASHNRRGSASKRTIGFFSEVLPVRVCVDENDNFASLLHKIRTEIFETVRSGDFPAANPSQGPIYDVVINYHKAAFNDFCGMQASPEWIHTGHGFESLMLQVHDFSSKGRLALSFDFHNEVFSEQQAAMAIRHFLQVLDAVTEHPSKPISSLNLMSADELRLVLHEWNATETTVGTAPCITAAFEEQADQNSTAIAVLHHNETLSYGELNRRANQLARYIVRLGVGPNSVVGIYLDRSFEMIVAILAVLKAGGAYVPIELGSPTERIAFLIKDTGLSLLLTRLTLLEKLPGKNTQAVCLDSTSEAISYESDRNLGGRSKSYDLAYVVYTSGSTGEPKGVEITHGALANFVSWAVGAYDLRGDDRVLQFASVGFDAAIEEIFPTLLQGATLILRTEESISSIQTFVDRCREWQVSVLDLPTSYWHQLTEVAFREKIVLPESIRLVIIGGEAASPKGVTEWRQTVSTKCRLINTYGPTEATVVATTCDLIAAGGSTTTLPTVPIGRPIANVRVYVLDRRLEPVPIGVAGELCIAGMGLARSYRNNPALTAQKFVTKSFGNGLEERLYRTGDIVRYDAEGRLEFLGRADDQVKIMGYRVEPSEIEGTLMQYPGVKESVATAIGSGRDAPRLVAYVVPLPGGSLTAEELKAYLSRKLPLYMMPTAIVFIEKVVRSPNGKVDRRALPSPELSMMNRGAVAADVRSPMEQCLAGIWYEVLPDVQCDIHQSFFEVGGNSLGATQIISRVREIFNVELPFRAIFETPTIAGLANQIQLALQASRDALECPSIVSIDRSQELPLSFSQTRMWFMHEVAPESPAYNLGVALRLVGPLNRRALMNSIDAIVRRHESIRTVFPSISGQPRQVINDWLPVSLKEIDLQTLPLNQRSATAKRLVSEESRGPFDLAQDLLMRVMLIRLAEEEHVLAINMHHIVSDQWSMGIIARELTHLYNSFCTRSQAQLASVKLQYADFAVWQRQWLTGDVLERQLAYWREQLKDMQPLVLPTDRPRPSTQSFNGAFVTYDIPAHLIDRLSALGTQVSATLYMMFLAVFKVLLFRYSGQSDVVVGSPVANRNWLAVENIVGTFVNTLVLRTDLGGDPSFHEVLSRVRDVTIDAFGRQETPFEKLVEVLKPQRDSSQSPLVQVLFNFQNAPLGDLQLHNLAWTPFEFDPGASQFDLCLSVDPNVLNKILLVYNPDLFDESRAARMLEHYTNLLEAFTQNPHAKIGQVDYLSQLEKTAICAQSVRAETEFPAHLRMHELFEAQVRRCPHTTAVSREGESLTYQELNNRANQLARYLRSQGIASETPVGVCMERSLEMVVAVIGILKAGGCYVPVDPDYPAERIGLIFEDSASPLIVTKKKSTASLPKSNAQVLCIDENWCDIAHESTEDMNRAGASEDLAYVIFTSGSTGRPKGVQVRHKALVNFLLSMAKEPGIEAGDVMLSVTPLAFDISALEILLPLTIGAQVEIIPREVALDGNLLKERINLSDATVMQATPATWRMLIEAGWQGKGDLRILCGGEALTEELAQSLLARSAALFNMYGPTETTIWSTVWKVPAGSSRIAIGYPIANTSIYVLDANQLLAPIGIIGELHIGGAGLARGYLNRAVLTAEKFIPNPFSRIPGDRMYRTGDLARYLPDGNIEVLGRIDNQVKIRGYRIELGEIEEVLRESPALREVVVVAHEDNSGDRRLIAYVVGVSGAALSSQDVRKYAQQKLPNYMIPSIVTFLDSLPLTPNGKLDRKALPALSTDRHELVDVFVAPRTPTEQLLAQIWSEVLKVDKVGIHDNFFDLGGHSLLAIQLISRVRDHFHAEIPVRILFELPTVAHLAEQLTQMNRANANQPDMAEMLIELEMMSEEDAKELAGNGSPKNLNTDPVKSILK